MPLDSATLLAFLANAVVQVAIVAAGAAVALRLMRAASACVKYRIAIVGLALCGAVPLWFAWPAPRVDGLTFVTPPVNTSTVADSYAAVVISGYLAVVLWKIVTLLRAALASRRLGRQSVPISDGPILAAFQRRALRSRDIGLRRSARVKTPLVCGVLRPAIVFPDAFTESDGHLIDAVIAHECAHVARHDLAVTIAMEVLTAPVAAHPAVAALKRAAARHREVACDEMAMARLGMHRATYASLLARVARWRVDAVSAAGLGAAALLEARVRALLEVPGARPGGVGRHLLAALCLATAAAAAPVTTIAVAGGWRDLSGAWTLDVNQTQPRGDVALRAARLRIDATSARVHIAQQRTRADGVAEAYEIRRTTDDVPSDVALPGGMVMRTRARWEGGRLVTDSSSPDGAWREQLEVVAAGNRLVITAERVTGQTRSRRELVFRRE